MIILIILRDRLNPSRNYNDFWDYIRSLDKKYSHCIDYCILVHTSKSVGEITRDIRNLDSRFQFLVVDVTNSEGDGWLAKSFWDKWKENRRLTSINKVAGTDIDGGVVGEKGEDGMKVLSEYLKSHPEAKKEFDDNIYKLINSNGGQTP